MSREGKWTPGPWDRTNLTIHTLGTRERGCLRIARVYESGVETDAAGTPEQTTANARLIAAAPQMAEALRRIALRRCEDDSDGGCDLCEPCIARAALRAAGVE